MARVSRSQSSRAVSSSGVVASYFNITISSTDICTNSPEHMFTLIPKSIVLLCSECSVFSKVKTVLSMCRPDRICLLRMFLLLLKIAYLCRAPAMKRGTVSSEILGAQKNLSKNWFMRFQKWHPQLKLWKMNSIKPRSGEQLFRLTRQNNGRTYK